MTDVDKLIEAADKAGPWPIGLSAFCGELAAQLTEKARQKALKKNRGHVEYGKHIGTAVVELNAVADALRKHATAQAGTNTPCGAVSVDGAPCVRLGPHEAHTYDERRGGPVEQYDNPSTGDVPAEAVCGIEDIYPTHDTSKTPPDRCLKPPHDTSTPHEGSWSKWPWQEPLKVTHMAAVLHHADPVVPKVAETIAYLKGDTDELGTEPLFVETGLSDRVVIPGSFEGKPFTESEPLSTRLGMTCVCPTDQKVYCAAPDCHGGADLFTEPRGEVQVSGVVHGPSGAMAVSTTVTGADAEKVMAGVMKGFSMPAQANQPDPFDDAVPEAPKRSGVWMGGALPVEPDPRPLWLANNLNTGLPLSQSITSIRTTGVRMGEECGLQYRLVSRDQVPEVPSWANIGGSTLHACAQRYETAVMEGMAAQTLDEATAHAWWSHFFALEISVTETETPFGRQFWRKADKGSEGEEWWNEAGPIMVRDYSAFSAQMHADGWSILMVPGTQNPPTREFFPPVPAMELAMRTPLPGGGELTGHLDQAWTRFSANPDEGAPWEILVLDLKSGSRMPEDDWQLQAYPFELQHRLAEAGMDLSHLRWSAAYYDARNGKMCDPVIPRMDGSEIVYRAGSVLAMHQHNNYPANPGSTWKAPCYLCAVRYACPIMATRKD